MVCALPPGPAIREEVMGMPIEGRTMPERRGRGWLLRTHIEGGAHGNRGGRRIPW